MKESTGSDAPCSGYMREMQVRQSVHDLTIIQCRYISRYASQCIVFLSGAQSFIARIHTQHLSKYHCEEELEKM